MDFHNPIQQYQKIGAATSVAEASPHRLIELLLQNTLDRIAVAKGHMLREEISEKGSLIGDAISLIDGLRLGLNKQQGGDIAQNLEDLYDYVQRRLVEANVKNDAAMLDEVAALLGQIKEAWSAIANAH
jgi:flagellar secretion chaperone FliS